MRKASEKQSVAVLQTGIKCVDQLSDCNGIPLGRIIQIHGKESSGKSTVALQIVAAAQRQGVECVWIEVEHTFNPVLARALGVILEDLGYIEPNYGEEALSEITDLLSDGKQRLFVIDTIAALKPRRVIEGDLEAAEMGAQALMFAKWYPKIVADLELSKSILILINQMRANVSAFGHAEPYSYPGGWATKFYSTMRIEVTRLNKVKQGEKYIGYDLQLRCVKNKVGRPLITTVGRFFYGEGLSQEADKLQEMLDTGLITKKGRTYFLGVEKIGTSEKEAREYLKKV